MNDHEHCGGGSFSRRNSSSNGNGAGDDANRRGAFARGAFAKAV